MIKITACLSLTLICFSSGVRAQEVPPQLVARSLAVHGARWVSGDVADWIAAGKLTYFTVDGPQATFDVRLMRKGRSQVQRIVRQPGGEVRQGSDGIRTWDSLGGRFASLAQGNALAFIESQTVRSVQSLLNYAGERLSLSDLREDGGRQVIEARDTEGRTTSYFIDARSALITRLEFVVGESRNAFSQAPIPVVESWVFSDFRQVEGLLTPFRIERYRAGIKVEEMQFDSVSYNAAVKDDVFKP